MTGYDGSQIPAIEVKHSGRPHRAAYGTKPPGFRRIEASNLVGKPHRPSQHLPDFRAAFTKSRSATGRLRSEQALLPFRMRVDIGHGGKDRLDWSFDDDLVAKDRHDGTPGQTVSAAQMILPRFPANREDADSDPAPQIAFTQCRNLARKIHTRISHLPPPLPETFPNTCDNESAMQTSNRKTTLAPIAPTLSPGKMPPAKWNFAKRTQQVVENKEIDRNDEPNGNG